MFRKANELFSGFKRKMDAVDEILKTIKDKIEHSASSILLLVKAVEELLVFLSERKGKRKRKS
jgi:hypothetical protein